MKSVLVLAGLLTMNVMAEDAPPAKPPVKEQAPADANKPKDATEQAPPEAAKPKESTASPQRFIPSEQVRSDFDVSFPVDI